MKFRKLLDKFGSYLDSLEDKGRSVNFEDDVDTIPQKSTGLRVIKTARSEKAMNEAIDQGYKLLFKRVLETDKFKSKYKLVQHKKTQKILELGDYRFHNEKDYKILIDWTSYNPAAFRNPYAAYLMPKDIKKGERVLIEDLIEHYVSGTWNQGDVYRLSKSEAMWNGKDFDVDVSSYAMGDIIG